MESQHTDKQSQFTNNEKSSFTSLSPAPLRQVTPLSKYLAMTLFVALPFVGGYIGWQMSGNSNMMAEEYLSLNSDNKEVSNVEICDRENEFVGYYSEDLLSLSTYRILKDSVGLCNNIVSANHIGEDVVFARVKKVDRTSQWKAYRLELITGEITSLHEKMIVPTGNSLGMLEPRMSPDRRYMIYFKASIESEKEINRFTIDPSFRTFDLWYMLDPSKIEVYVYDLLSNKVVLTIEDISVATFGGMYDVTEPVAEWTSDSSFTYPVYDISALEKGELLITETKVVEMSDSN